MWNVTSGNLKFGNSNAERMRIDSSGNVGIGTTSPDGKLSVTSTTVNSEDVLYLKSGADSVGDYLGLAFEIGVGGNGPYGAVRTYGGPSGNDSYMSFLTTTDGGTLVQQMTIDHVGNVGIGVTDPDCSLEIGGTSAMSVPAGTTAQEPGTPRDGMVRYDETTEKFVGRVDGAWHTFTTASVQPDVQFSKPSTSHIRGTISAAGKIFTMSGSGYSGVSTNLNFEGNFIIITSWQHDYMGMGIAYKDDITNADFTGESADSNGFYMGAANTDGFTSSTSFHGAYHAPSGQGGSTNATKHYFMHKRTGNVVRMDYSTNAAAATDPDHASWTTLIANQTISSSNHVKPGWGEAGGGAGNDPLRMLYTDVTGATNSD